MLGGAVGGFFSAVLKSVYATLVRTMGIGDVFAAASSLVLLMMFIYLAALTLFLGAEVAKAADEEARAKTLNGSS
jgi:uncharacterized BrkB/YihY/UPF0761 family membrane protein